MFKSRLSKENKEVECLLNYDTGLDRYYGLVDLALESGVWTNSANRVVTENDQKVYPKAIYKDPDKYFTPKVMEEIEQLCNDKYRYGGTEIDRADNSDKSDTQ